jgi:putative toxin-antitoxin system antitoxin component (TIGR02293 family)
MFFSKKNFLPNGIKSPLTKASCLLFSNKKYNFILNSIKYYTMPKKIIQNKEKKQKITLASPSKRRAIYRPGRHSLHSSPGYPISGFVVIMDPATKPENHLTALEKMSIVRVGMTKKDLESLKEKTALGYDDLARILSVTRATLINKKGDEKFSTTLSERIFSIADIYSYGYEVFGDKDKFNQWMSKPNSALAGESPYALIDNCYGREEVKNIIGRIDYGVYS